MDISEKYQEVLLLNNSPYGAIAKDQIAELKRVEDIFYDFYRNLHKYTSIFLVKQLFFNIKA